MGKCVQLSKISSQACRNLAHLWKKQLAICQARIENDCQIRHKIRLQNCSWLQICSRSARDMKLIQKLVLSMPWGWEQFVSKILVCVNKKIRGTKTTFLISFLQIQRNMVVDYEKKAINQKQKQQFVRYLLKANALNMNCFRWAAFKSIKNKNCPGLLCISIKQGEARYTRN